MVDALIIIIVLVLLFIALKGSVRHFRGEGPCCGGLSSPVREKTLSGPVMAERRMRIDGMHCQNCAARVKKAIDEIEGAVSEVDFASGIAVVRMDRSIDDIVLKKAVEKAGYTVLSISGQ